MRWISEADEADEVGEADEADDGCLAEQGSHGE